MPKQLVIVLVGCSVVASLLIMRPGPPGREEIRTTTITRGPLTVWSDYEGVLESLTVRGVMSQLNGPATIIELVPDGSRVESGEVVARFDSSQWQRELRRLERDYAVARADLDILLNVRHPLELQEMEARLAEAQRNFEEEKNAWEAERELYKDQLVSDRELRQQELRTEAASTRLESLRRQFDLTRNRLHPALVERTQATLAAAEQELTFARQQAANCIVRAPIAGVVTYKPIPIGGEFRPARVGDIVFPNQVFAVIPDMSNLVVRCDIPEADLTRVPEDGEVLIFPLAYPDMMLEGKVQSISSMVQTVPGRGGGQKQFGVVIQVLNPNSRLRSGMSVRIRVRSYSHPNTLLIPRTAVLWENNQPFCQLTYGSTVQKVRVRVGLGNETHFEVLDGLREGDRVIAP
ncbi:MAG: efflux RND transporter periplasmic adaptor subunit [Kiritimatiellia bacterium]